VHSDLIERQVFFSRNNLKIFFRKLFTFHRIWSTTLKLASKRWTMRRRWLVGWAARRCDGPKPVDDFNRLALASFI